MEKLLKEIKKHKEGKLSLAHIYKDVYLRGYIDALDIVMLMIKEESKSNIEEFICQACGKLVKGEVNSMFIVCSQCRAVHRVINTRKATKISLVKN